MDESKTVTTTLIESELTERIIGAAMEVHRRLGPGLLESVYETCLCHELDLRAIPYRRQQPVAIQYKGLRVERGLVLDLVIADKVIIELKSVSKIEPVHEAQIITYLKLTGLTVGFIINFNVTLLKDGIRRKIGMISQ